jgi:large-conductance mechanosensitive channel
VGCIAVIRSVFRRRVGGPHMSHKYHNRNNANIRNENISGSVGNLIVGLINYFIVDFKVFRVISISENCSYEHLKLPYIFEYCKIVWM